MKNVVLSWSPETHLTPDWLQSPQSPLWRCRGVSSTQSYNVHTGPGDNSRGLSLVSSSSILASHWSSLVTWSGYWPLIGWERHAPQDKSPGSDPWLIRAATDSYDGRRGRGRGNTYFLISKIAKYSPLMVILPVIFSRHLLETPAPGGVMREHYLFLQLSHWVPSPLSQAPD